MSTGNTVIVTGTSRGIGRSIAERLASEGHTVIGLSRSVPSDHPGLVNYQVDLADSAQIEKFIARILHEHDVYGLVNNAGLLSAAALSEANEQDFAEMMAVNIRAAFTMTKAVVPLMRRRRSGRIVTIGSRAALGKHARIIYGMTKAGLVGLSRNLALELAPDNITVNVVSPGPIATELFQAGNPPDHPKTKALVASIPAGRIGKPEDVAAAVSFFLHPDASFITGQNLYVCGGSSLGSVAL